MIFIDANVFIAFHNDRDVHHKRAKEIIADIEQQKYGQWLTSDYVFNEVIGVVTRKLGKEHAIQLGQYIQDSIPILHIGTHLLKDAWGYFSTTSLNLNFVDCTTLATLPFIEEPHLTTFDKEFSKVSGFSIIQ